MDITELLAFSAKQGASDLHLLVVQGRQIDTPHIPVHSNHRWQASRQMQVRCPLFGAERQQLSDIHSASQFQ